MRSLHIGGRHFRQITALVVASTFLAQNFAWAVCSDGLALPAGNQGYQFQLLPPTLQNMSPGVFTGTAGSVFVPDNSIAENNDPANGTTTTANTTGIAGLPAGTVTGHNWAFDQGSTTCKQTDIGPAGQPGAGWAIPPNTTTDCLVLPVVRGGTFTNFGDLPLTGQVLVPTCDPTKLSAVGAPRSWRAARSGLTTRPQRRLFSSSPASRAACSPRSWETRRIPRPAMPVALSRPSATIRIFRKRRS